MKVVLVQPPQIELHQPRAYISLNYEIKCKCGCGGKLLKLDKQGRSRSFINGHNSNIRPKNPNFSFKERKHSIKSKKKMSRALKEAYRRNPNLRQLRSKTHKNKIMSLETRNKESIVHIKYYEAHPEVRKILSKFAQKRVGEKNPFYGKKHSIATKLKISKSRIGKYMGEASSFWKGGTSFEPYTRIFYWLKNEILKRDNYMCCVCGTTKNKNGRKLSIHHIDYDKKNDSSKNLIALCNPCHNKTFTNREYWIEYFTEIMRDKYD